MNSLPFVNAWIGLGGNIGSVQERFELVLQKLDQHRDCSILAVSSLYKTAPWGNTNQAWFLNCCLKIATKLDPEALLQLCLNIEKELGRKRVEKWGPRLIDIDLLLYENQKINLPERLILPHPWMLQRDFVLFPLAEISPELILDGVNILERIKHFPANSVQKCHYESFQQDSFQVSS